MKNSAWMELVGLQRCLEFLLLKELVVATIVTDRHRQIAKWLRENRPDISHLYDIWHVGRSEYKYSASLIF